MKYNIGINGFGRIGRVVLRQAMARPWEFDVKAINYRNVDLDYMAYMLKSDSVFGRSSVEVTTYPAGLKINGVMVPVFDSPDPKDAPWGEMGCNYVIDSTGAILTTEKAQAHLEAGAKKVILTAPAKDNEIPTFVMGVNHNEYTPDMTIVSNASCTTNCLAPLAKVINDKFGLERGLMTTIHSVTGKQSTTDSRNMKDWRVGRSVFENIIPTTTGAAKAVGKVIPELKGKLTGLSVRVPTADVSMVDLTCVLKTPTTYDEICKALKEAAQGEMHGVLAYTEDEVVSTDFIGDTHGCIFDAKAGIMLDDTMVKLIAWYDNEWGYSAKVLDLVSHMGKTDAIAAGNFKQNFVMPPEM